MLRKAFFALALVAALSTSAFAVTNVAGGDHVFTVGTGLQTFPIIATSDSGEQIAGIDLYMVMDALGPIITEVNLIVGTVFEPNNVGQSNFGAPEYLTPGREPAYFTTTSAGSVPTGTVALVTIDTNSADVGQYLLALEIPIFGPSAVYVGATPGTFSNGSVTLVPVPEPGSVVLALFGAAGLGAVAIRRRRRNA